MIDCVDGFVESGICEEDIGLIVDSYREGYGAASGSCQSCLPVEILESNLIRRLLVDGLPEHWKQRESGVGDVIGFMARAYYDGFNKRIVESGALFSGCLD